MSYVEKNYKNRVYILDMVTYSTKDSIIDALYNLQRTFVGPRQLVHEKYGKCKLEMLPNGLLYVSWKVYDKRTDGTIEMGVCAGVENIESIDVHGDTLYIHGTFDCTRERKYNDFQMMSFIARCEITHQYNLLETNLADDMKTSI